VELSGGELDATNNRMELRAAIMALRALDGPHRVELTTDSTYLRQGITEWLPRWRQNGWRTAAKGEVKNQDLWEELSAELDRHQVRWTWTRGHSGDHWNERADELASAAIPRLSLPVCDPEAVHLFLASAFSGKLSVGGWAAVLQYRDTERRLSGRVEGTTANRMHVQSAVEGLAALKRPVRVHVYTSSDYLKDGATTWVRAWRARGWTTKEGKPVSHRDMWQRLERVAARHEVHWHVADRDELPEELTEAKRLARGAVQGVDEE
jgi:ribonuclease HI